MHGALAIAPKLGEAHTALADYYRDKLARGQAAGAGAARFEGLLRAHDRGRHAAFLSGKGALTLVTDPPGAPVELYRYCTRTAGLWPSPWPSSAPHRWSRLCSITAATCRRGTRFLRLGTGRVEIMPLA